jgi:Domain of unknown function (DUF5668)
MHPRFSPETLALGVTLVALGVVALLANLGRLEFLETVRTYWPLALVIWGGLEVVASLGSRLSGRRS